MKKKSLLLISLLAVMASCSKEETPIVEEPENVIETETKTELFSLVANSNEDEASATKTSIGEGNVVLWSEGDLLSVIGENDNVKFTITSGVGTSKATFSGVRPKDTMDDSMYYVCYPYNVGNQSVSTCTDNEKQEVVPGIEFKWGGATQIATPGSFDPAKAPLFGVFSSTDISSSNITLKHVTAFVKVTTDQRCKSITLTSKDENPLACEHFWIYKGADGNPVISSLSLLDTGHSNTVTLVGEDGADIMPGTYYIAVLPLPHTSGLSLSFVSADDTPYTDTKSSDSSITFKRKTITNFGKFTLPVEEFNFTGGGTAESPYKISTLVELNDFAILAPQNGWTSLNYCLGADIDCQEKTIGVDSFKGTFDGGNHTITNYTARQNGYSSGLFITVTDATIENLSVNCNGIAGTFIQQEDGDLTNDYYSLSPLVGSSYSSSETSYTTIKNCSATGSFTVTVPMIYGSLGAIVGNVYDKIIMSGCTNNANITIEQRTGYRGMINFGGIVGGIQGKTFETYATLDRLRNNGKLLINCAAKINIGGIVGRVSDSPEDICLRLYNSVNSGLLRTNDNAPTGEFVRQNQTIGGMIGFHDSDGYWTGLLTTSVDPYIVNCLNKGQLLPYNSSVNEGGIMGDCYDNDTKVYNCANTGEITDWVSDNLRVGHGTMCGGSPDLTDDDFGDYSYCHWTNESMYIVSLYTGNNTPDPYSPATDCSREDPLTAALMNLHYSDKIPQGITACQWKGTSADGSLDLDF